VGIEAKTGNTVFESNHMNKFDQVLSIQNLEDQNSDGTNDVSYNLAGPSGNSDTISKPIGNTIGIEKSSECNIGPIIKHNLIISPIESKKINQILKTRLELPIAQSLLFGLPIIGIVIISVLIHKLRNT